MRTIPIRDQIESLLDLADEMKLAGRRDTAIVLIDATRVLKSYQFQKRQARLENSKKKQSANMARQMKEVV